MRGGAAMDTVVRMLLLGLVVMSLGVIGGVSGQTPTPAQTPAPAPPAPIVGNIYSVAYVEVMPTSEDDAASVLRALPRSRAEGGRQPPLRGDPAYRSAAPVRGPRDLDRSSSLPVLDASLGMGSLKGMTKE